jgi:hypothetical protein
MASQPPDPPLITLITSTLPIVQPVGLPPTTFMVLFLSFDENPNQDPRAHIQKNSNAVVMNLVNDDRYVLLWFSLTLKGKVGFSWTSLTYHYTNTIYSTLLSITAFIYITYLPSLCCFDIL